jgi:hypothetical protein
VKTRWLLVLLALAPHAARAQDASAMRGVVHQRFIALLNPMGMEHAAAFGLRGPLGDQDDLLFMGAHAETGVIGYVSPVFAQNGAYIEVQPLSFLSFRGEILHQLVWPIGMDGAGYYGVQGYDPDVGSLPADEGASADGWSGALSVTGQGMIPMGEGVRLVFFDEASVQYAALGDASHYYDMKWNVVRAREDWVVLNSAALLLTLDLSRDIAVRIGAYDDLRYVPASGHLAHQVGGIAMLEVERAAPEVPAIHVFVRGGYYTSHALFGGQYSMLAGLAVDYDLGAVR